MPAIITFMTGSYEQWGLTWLILVTLSTFALASIMTYHGVLLYEKITKKPEPQNENLPPPQKTTRPDTPIWQAIHYLKDVLRDGGITGNGLNHFAPTRKVLHRALLDGQISVIGQRKGNADMACTNDAAYSSVHSPIPAEFWEKYELAPSAAESRDENVFHTQPIDRSWEFGEEPKYNDYYRNLLVDMAEIKAVWPGRCS